MRVIGVITRTCFHLEAGKCTGQEIILWFIIAFLAWFNPVIAMNGLVTNSIESH